MAVLKPRSSCNLLHFEKQTRRPALESTHGCHEQRFNYFDSSRVHNSTKNIKVHKIAFDKMAGRRSGSDMFKVAAGADYVTEEDKR